MKCRNCKRTIEDNSLFCNWCGAEQLKRKGEYVVPEPVKRDGYYSGRITVNGKKITVKGKTRKEYIDNCQKIKKGASPTECPTLGKAIDNYISINSNTLSPSTLRGYKIIRDKRFQSYMKQAIDTIRYQEMVNNEAKQYSPKTVKNAWGLVSKAVKETGYSLPAVNLPKVPIPQTEFLDHKQVKTFLKAIKGDDVEAAAILALHSLRSSELRHISAEDITDNTIHVRGAVVRNDAGKWVDKDTNKNRTSTRDIPIIIPRLLDLLPKTGKVVTMPEETIRQHLKRICEANNLPVVSLHDLRRTFASLAAYLQWREETICAVGGWRPGSPIVHSIYIKVSDTAIKEDIKKMSKFFKSAVVREVSDLDSSSMAKSTKK